MNTKNWKIQVATYLLLGLLFTACSAPKKAMYETIPNDVAQIELLIRKNQKFELYFKDLSERPEKRYKFKGSWSERKDRIQLNFHLDKNGLPDIKALFDPSLTEVKSVRIIDTKTVEFKKTDKMIYIWGLSCPKTDLEKK
ncbi:MAG: hypothetical protein JNL65_09745 [Saprospiraceae bacterium]|nr:hypothetical protein [Saprospiraceae bacterium]HRG67341.1 hypothetical protein [Saprospiraceae bacterium]